MSKIKILIVEDELLVAMSIQEILSDIGYEVIQPVTNYADAVYLLKNEQPDIALLDIALNGEKSGIDLAEYINEKIHIPFIFLTSKSDARTLNMAKKHHPNAYLTKPFNQADLFTAIELAIYNYKSLHCNENKNPRKNLFRDAIFIKDNQLFHKVKFSDILYAKSEHVYVELYTLDGKKYLVRTSMNRFFEDLPENFFRVHRSYSVNLDYLETINSLFIIIKGIQIPVGKIYRTQLMERIEIIK